MFFVYGRSDYGEIESCAGNSVTTQFAHVWWIPLIPIGSRLSLAEGPAGVAQRLPIGISLRSVLVGYARALSVVAVIPSVLWLVDALSTAADDPTSAVVALVGTLAIGAFALAAFARFGRLSREQIAQRFAYADFVGYFIDPRWLREPSMPVSLRIDSVMARVRERLTERARALTAAGYRVAPDPAFEWAAIALDPTVTDAYLLRAALTLARLEHALATERTRRAHFADTHARIWSRLRTLDPTLLARAGA